MKKKVAVVIPYYHSDLSETEKISLDNCCNVLNNYPIILIVPERMDEEEYPDNKSLLYKKVPDSWLVSIEAYNKMMLSKEFYQCFFEYEYILIFQLDAFVFRDELMEFCSLGYDYIGAPWLCGQYLYVDNKHCIWHVGNGGLSLRRVKNCYNVLEQKQSYLSRTKVIEDKFFSSVISNDFRIAAIDVALKFAFEREVEKCFIMNNNKLPFGCHAWERYNIIFWKKYIEQMGYEISDDLKKFGNEDELLRDVYIKEEKRSFYWKYIYTPDHLLVALKMLLKKDINRYVIWGAGRMGNELSNRLLEAGIDIEYFCDNDPAILGKKINKWLVCSPQILMRENKCVNVIVAIKAQSWEAICQLERYGFKYGSNCTRYEDILTELLRQENCY